jgi:hypothetical protein
MYTNGSARPKYMSKLKAEFIEYRISEYLRGSSIIYLTFKFDITTVSETVTICLLE